MFKKILKLFTPFLLVGSSLYSDVNYLPLYNDAGDSSSSGYWQMVGIAGFSQDEYKVVNDGAYFVKYISNDDTMYVEDSYTQSADTFSSNLENYDTLMFAVKIRNNTDVESLVFKFEEDLEVTSSANADPTITTYIGVFGNDDIEVMFNSQLDGKTITFFLNQNPSTVYQITLDSTDMANSVTVASEIDPDIYIVTENVKEAIDLYFYDNPGFGGNSAENINNFDSSIHQSYLREGNDTTSSSPYSDYLRDKSELRIYSWDTDNSNWLYYNSLNKDNDLYQLQVGKGYWMRLKTITDNVAMVLDINESYFESGNEINYTMAVLDANDNNIYHEFTFDTSEVTSIEDFVKEFNDNQGETIKTTLTFPVYASKLADNQVLLTATSTFELNTSTSLSGGFMYFKMPYDSDDSLVELNTSENADAFDDFKNKAGLVLGDEHIKVSNHAIYASIAKKGWNLLTLPSSPIREAITAMLIDFDESAVNNANPAYCLNIADSFYSNSVRVRLKDSVRDTTSNVALGINYYVDSQMSSGDISSEFNIRAYPLDGKILLLSDKEFTISTDDCNGNTGTEHFGAVTDLTGDVLQSDLAYGQTATSNYGEFGILVRPNIFSYFVDSNLDGYPSNATAKITINGSTEVNVKSDDANASTFATAINTADDSIYTYVIDEDFDGNFTNGMVLLASDSIFSIEDKTHTRVYKYTEPTSDSYFTVYGSGTNQNYGDEERILAETNVSAFASAINNTKSVFAGSVNSDYLIIASTEQAYLDVKESYTNENDILEDILNYSVLGDDINHSQGALIEGFNLDTLIDLSVTIKTISGEYFGYLDLSNPDIDNIASHPFWTNDLVADNALVALADESYANLMPRMIVGGTTDTDSGTVHWEQLNTTKSLSTWYNDTYNYNLFSTNSQKAYWVYLDDPVENTIVFDEESTTVTKRNVRHYNNETGEVKNYVGIDVITTVNGLLNDGELEGLVYVSLSEIANLVDDSFILRRAILNTFKGSINSFEIPSINEDANLTTVTLVATNGRTHRVTHNTTIDIQKPSTPELSFNYTPSTLTMSSEDESDTGVVKYMIFQDSIDDMYGIGNEDEVKNFIAEVTATAGGETTLEICSEVSYDELDEVPLIVVALDDDDDTKANVSDMARINFAPVHQGTHKVTSTDGVEGSLPVSYDNSCTETVESETSGISIKSLVTEEISIVYKPNDSVSTGISGTPTIMYVGTDANNNAVAQIKYNPLYEGDVFYLYYGGASGGTLYKGTFSEKDEENNPTDSEGNAVVLTPVTNGNFVDGGTNTEASDQSI